MAGFASASPRNPSSRESAGAGIVSTLPATGLPMRSFRARAFRSTARPLSFAAEATVATRSAGASAAAAAVTFSQIPQEESALRLFALERSTNPPPSSRPPTSGPPVRQPGHTWTLRSPVPRASRRRQNRQVRHSRSFIGLAATRQLGSRAPRFIMGASTRLRPAFDMLPGFEKQVPK